MAMTVSLAVAERNIKVIDHSPDLLVADDEGNLSAISRYNFLGRLVLWIRHSSSKKIISL